MLGDVLYELYLPGIQVTEERFPLTLHRTPLAECSTFRHGRTRNTRSFVTTPVRRSRTHWLLRQMTIEPRLHR
jgi:hypothetical protein